MFQERKRNPAMSATSAMVGEGCKRDGSILIKENLMESPMTIIEKCGEVLECGGSLQEVFGLEASELRGRDWFGVFIGGDGDDHLKRTSALKAAVADLDNHSTFTFVADYKSRSFKWSGFVFSAEGKARRVVLIAEDITGCRESVLQLERHMVELERMTRAQSSRELRMGEMRRKIKDLENSLVHCKDKAQV
jgi:PAS domain S-box-containing protein